MKDRELNTGNAVPVLWFDDRGRCSVHVTGADKETWLSIRFQDGLVADHGNNGICMLDILDALLDRMAQFERKWPREENRQAMTKMREAKFWLIEKRRNRRLEGLGRV